MILLLVLSTFAASLASPILNKEQRKTFETILERINDIQLHRNEVKSLEEDRARLQKLFIDETRQVKDGDMLQREAPANRQVGDRRLKCALFDSETKKCLRHKVSFLWGRR